MLLHAGILLILINQLVVYFLHKEEQMTIAEGQTTNYASDIRQVELSVVDKKSSAIDDDVLAVPESLLRDSLENHKPVVDVKQQLPFDVRMLDYYENSNLVRAGEDSKKPSQCRRRFKMAYPA